MTVTDYVKAAGDFLAQRKGLPVLVGVALVLANLVLSFLPAWPAVEWLRMTDILLQIGVIVGLLGVLLGDAL